MTDLATDDARTDDDWERAIDDDLPPARSRRKLVTPLTAGLCAILIAAAGFIAGVQVQKGSQDGTASGATGARAGFPGAGAGAGGGAAGAAGGTAAGGTAAGTQQDVPTFGTVASKKGTTLYVKDADGTTVRVKTNAQSKVTRNAATSPKGIYPGDTVVVQGTKDKGGNLVATQIAATSKTAAAAGGGGFGGGGGLRRQFAAPPGG